jgi:hypothetical protein
MKRIFGVVLGVSLFVAGCADPVAPTTPTPAVPTVTDTFSDTLLMLGANTHQFTVAAVGGVKVSLASVVPGAAVGIGIGTPSGGSCSPLDHLAPAVAGQAAQLSGTATVPGSYCVVIYDLVDQSGVGSIPEPVAYTINVLHS